MIAEAEAVRALAMWLAQADPVTTKLFDLGGVGVVAATAGIVIRILFNRVTATHDAQIARITTTHDAEIARLREIHLLDRERADRLESENRELNRAIQDRIVPALGDAAHTMADTLAELRRRDGA